MNVGKSSQLGKHHLIFSLFSSTYVMWETICVHKQVSGWTVNFCPNFPESPFPEFQTRKPPLPTSENFRFEMTKVYSGIPPHFRKLQIWDDQTLLRNTPPFRKTSDLRWPKFTPEYPPHISENVGDHMWRLILTPQGYHSFVACGHTNSVENPWISQSSLDLFQKVSYI